MSQLHDELKRLGSSLVSDVLDEVGYHNQTLCPGLSEMGREASFCGPAICVQSERQVVTNSVPRSSATMPLYELPLLTRDGAVVILATNGFRGGAVTGGLLASELKLAGCAALVTDGLIRDRNELSEIGLPIRAAGAIPVNGARRIRITGWSQPVMMPGPEGASVSVRPNDVLLGDRDGIIVLPHEIAQEVLLLAQELQRREDSLRADAARLTAKERALARAKRMSHVAWLRECEEGADS